MTDLLVSDEELAQRAAQVRPWAYAPYSHYLVGAALLMASGKVYEAVNVENAVYPLSLCAERAAIAKAVSEGEREVVAVAVATSNGGTPCGACRQVLAEFGVDARVLIADGEGHLLQRFTVRELLPEAFGPEHLP
jgi:cytidine deaminase